MDQCKDSLLNFGFENAAVACAAAARIEVAGARNVAGSSLLRDEMMPIPMAGLSLDFEAKVELWKQLFTNFISLIA